MRSFGFEDWQRWQREGCTLLPVVTIHRDEPSPLSWEKFATTPASALLESAQAGRYSYLCDRPRRVIIGRADEAEIWSGDLAGCLEKRAGRPLQILDAVLRERRAPVLPESPAMMGGLIGVFGYDLVHTWERLPQTARRDLDVPLYAVIETGELFVYDHAQRTLAVVAWCEVDALPTTLDQAYRQTAAAAAAAYARWREAAPLPSSQPAATSSASRNEPVLPPRSAAMTPADFEAAAERVHEYIAAGHTYQVNLSRRTSRPTALAPEAVYEALRRVNPSPYMGLFRLPTFALVCGSPELLVKLERGVISSRPIAGTRPRGAALPDAHMSAELFASEKERAEHLMLVDLIRNDIGRVAAYGSVHVPEFMVLERYSHVMHIVSQVEGRLAPGCSWVEVFRSMFPGGTITGCPKIRTMEIIEELEPVGRGFYTGSLGWISYAGEMELNIVIRSMLLQDGQAHVQAGSGVVADSHPARELDESDRKAHALWVALSEAEHARAPQPHA